MDNIILELKQRKPATILWLAVMITGVSIAIFSWFTQGYILLGYLGSGIIFSSVLCSRYEKQINDHFDSKKMG